MLKLNYTEVGLYMERTMTSPEMLMQERVVLAIAPEFLLVISTSTTHHNT